MGSISRRRFCAALAAAATFAGCGAPRPTPASTVVAPISLPTATASPVGGRLLITRAGNFFILDLATLQESQLSHFPTGAFAASPVASPDRKRVAYTYFRLPEQQSDLGGSDLSVMDATGANARVIREHGKPGTSYEDPCWSADGTAIFVTRRSLVTDQATSQGDRVEIVRVGLDGSSSAPLLANAMMPAASPDGRTLAYVTSDEHGTPRRLWLAGVDGRGAQELLGNQGFSFIRSPRFAPDGSRLTFAAVGGPATASPTSDRPTRRLARLVAAVAEAHGVPWEIWTVRPDGRELRRLTHLQEDSPVPTWSPDGQWIAFAGELGLYLVDAAGTRTVRLSTRTSGGGLTWL